MSTLRAILELHGSLDTAVIATQDPRVMETADAFLPGTSTNAQWYREINAFMFPGGEDDDGEALADAAPVHAMEVLQRGWNEHQRRPSAPEASRLIYGLGAVIHLTKTVPTDSLPFEDPTSDARADLLAEVFALTGGQEPNEDNARIYRERLPSIVDVFVSEFNDWKDWYEVAQKLATDDFKVLSADAASVPLCLPSVVTVDGIESVVIDTELSTTKVSLNALKAVVDPRNWRKDYPSFFCHMEYEGLRADGWRKVLEYVGFCDIDEHIAPDCARC